MNGYYYFIFAFFALGLYTIVYTVVRIFRLDKESPEYAVDKKRLLKNIPGGLGLIGVGILIYLFKVI